MKRTGKQLKAVLVFREKIEREQRYLHKEYSSIISLRICLLASSWLVPQPSEELGFFAGSFDAKTRNPLGPLSSQTKYKQSGMGNSLGCLSFGRLETRITSLPPQYKTRNVPSQGEGPE